MHAKFYVNFTYYMIQTNVLCIVLKLKKKNKKAWSLNFFNKIVIDIFQVWGI